MPGHYENMVLVVRPIHAFTFTAILSLEPLCISRPCNLDAIQKPKINENESNAHAWFMVSTRTTGMHFIEFYSPKYWAKNAFPYRIFLQKPSVRCYHFGI